ncbi:phage holin family protein [Roseomonas sp. USHLN139]|uniref:phage holin family protein n=1 Tax=Roseomonas sp. USHLN139 TaxID=3081298 RepID=UPI003B01D09F
MSVFDPLPSVADIAWAFSAALAGRATLLLRVTRQAVTPRKILWTLFWEVPTACAMGLIGLALAQWAGLSAGGATLCIALLARIGPDAIEPLLGHLVPALKKAKP